MGEEIRRRLIRVFMSALLACGTMISSVTAVMADNDQASSTATAAASAETEEDAASTSADTEEETAATASADTEEAEVSVSAASATATSSAESTAESDSTNTSEESSVSVQAASATQSADTEATAEATATASVTAETVEYTKDNTVDVYRMYNPNSGEHFYTETYTERDNLMKAGWKYEGFGWTAPASDINQSVPVYRLYNPNSGLHHYTMSTEERDQLVSLGWRNEGVGWYSDGLKTVALYREYNPNDGTHNYTTSQSEDSHLVSVGWKQEGTGWYGVNDPDTTITHPVTVYNKRDFSDLYDYNYYISTYSDVANAYSGDDLKTLEHFVIYGIREGRNGKASYDKTLYEQVKEELYPTKTTTSETETTVAYPEAEWVFNVGLCERNLRAAFNFAKMTYKSGEINPSKGTHYYAHIGYSKHTGNCYVMAGTFCELAKALGYNAVQVYGWDPSTSGARLPHSWVEIDGKIYDPDVAVEVPSLLSYGATYGAKGTLRYHKEGTMGA